MNKTIAMYVVRNAYRSQATLQEILPLLKKECTEEEYKRYAIAIATAMDAVNSEIMNLVFETLPDLRDEIESMIKAYGRIV